MAGLAERLARAGLSAVTLNLSGSGVDDSGEFVYPERFGHNTFSAELQDLRRVTDALAGGELGVAPPSAVGLLGHSRGGGVAVLHTANDPRIKALATWAAISHRGALAHVSARRMARGGGERGEERPHRAGAAAVPRRARRHRAQRRRARHRGRGRAASPSPGSSSTVPRTRPSPWRRASGSRPPRREPASCAVDGAGHTFGAVHPVARRHPGSSTSRTRRWPSSRRTLR